VSPDIRRGDWLRCYRARPHARRRLVCFPPAGGAASFYRAWADELPADVELWAVQYPGREDRFTQPGVPDLAALADGVAAALDARLDLPTALFGHSMGASVAYEVTRRLEPRHGRTLLRLFVSARPAPEHQRAVDSPVHRRDDDALVAELRVLGGGSAEALCHPELRSALLPMIRNDFRIIETYRPASGPPLATGIVALTGDADPRLDVAQAADWAAATSGPFRLAVFGGGHYYLVPQRAAVVAEVLRALTTQEDTMAAPDDTTAVHPDLTVDGLRASVASVLGVEPDTIGPEDNLIAHGVDSIKVMLLASRWQEHGVEIPFGDLAAEPTVSGWARLLSGRPAPDAAPR